MTEGFIRVYFLDDSWATIPAKTNTPAKEICDTISKKRNLNTLTEQYSLYMVESNHDHMFERPLQDAEIPLEIQENVRKQGQLEHFKFVFKQNTHKQSTTSSNGAAAAAETEDAHSSDSDEEEMFGKSTKVARVDDAVKYGYLEKRGKRNTAWKERWFVLQGDRLLYFKSHDHPSAISYIPILDAVIRESPGRRSREYTFEINTKSRVFHLKARDHNDMASWIKELKKHTALEEENGVLDQIQELLEDIEYSLASEDEKRVEEISALQGVLRNPTALDNFMQFCVDNHCEENLLFWIDAEEYRRTDRSPEDARAKSVEIWNNYCKPEALHEIDIKQKERKVVEDLLSAGDPNREAFRELQSKTLALMESLTFPAFVNSKQFQRTLLKLPLMGTFHLEHHPYRKSIARAASAASSAAARESIELGTAGNSRWKISRGDFKTLAPQTAGFVPASSFVPGSAAALAANALSSSAGDYKSGSSAPRDGGTGSGSGLSLVVATPPDLKQTRSGNLLYPASPTSSVSSPFGFDAKSPSSAALGAVSPRSGAVPGGTSGTSGSGSGDPRSPANYFFGSPSGAGGAGGFASAFISPVKPDSANSSLASDGSPSPNPKGRVSNTIAPAHARTRSGAIGFEAKALQEHALPASALQNSSSSSQRQQQQQQQQRSPLSGRDDERESFTAALLAEHEQSAHHHHGANSASSSAGHSASAVRNLITDLMPVAEADAANDAFIDGLRSPMGASRSPAAGKASAGDSNSAERTSAATANNSGGESLLTRALSGSLSASSSAATSSAASSSSKATRIVFEDSADDTGDLFGGSSANANANANAQS